MSPWRTQWMCPWRIPWMSPWRTRRTSPRSSRHIPRNSRRVPTRRRRHRPYLRLSRESRGWYPRDRRRLASRNSRPFTSGRGLYLRDRRRLASRHSRPFPSDGGLYLRGHRRLASRQSRPSSRRRGRNRLRLRDRRVLSVKCRARPRHHTRLPSWEGRRLCHGRDGEVGSACRECLFCCTLVYSSILFPYFSLGKG